MERQGHYLTPYILTTRCVVVMPLPHGLIIGAYTVVSPRGHRKASTLREALSLAHAEYDALPDHSQARYIVLAQYREKGVLYSDITGKESTDGR